jgi:hypothetical protein
MVNLPDGMLGLSSTAFKQLIDNLDPGKGIKDLMWKGHRHELSIYTIPISALRYNFRNVRVKPWRGQHVHENDLAEDYWETVDEEAKSTQRIINDFLVKNPDRKEALKFFMRGEPQSINEPLICTPGGKVINGNQRLCVYRELYTLDKGKYAHLEHAYVAILPNEGSFSDERKFESSCQLEGLEAIFFDWVQQGLQDEEDSGAGETAEQIAQRTSRTAADVKESVRKITLSREFLEYCERPECWQDLRVEYNVTQAVKTLDNELNGRHIKGEEDRKKLKILSFRLMRDSEEATKGKGTSVHLLITKLARELDAIDDPWSSDDTSGEGGEDVDSILQPVKPRRGKKEQKKKVEVEIKDSSDLADAVIIADERTKGETVARNQNNYAKRQLKVMNSSLDNILSNWEKQNTKGIKTAVKNAINKLKKIGDKL